MSFHCSSYPLLLLFFSSLALDITTSSSNSSLVSSYFFLARFTLQFSSSSFLHDSYSDWSTLDPTLWSGFLTLLWFASTYLCCTLQVYFGCPLQLYFKWVPWLCFDFLWPLCDLTIPSLWLWMIAWTVNFEIVLQILTPIKCFLVLSLRHDFGSGFWLIVTLDVQSKLLDYSYSFTCYRQHSLFNLFLAMHCDLFAQCF